LADDLERQLGVPLRRGNTVAGRMLARLGELGGLVERAEILLDQLDPAHATVSREGDPFQGRGEGFAYLEAPAGALQHRMVLERGRIVHYDIISPSTWNGSPRDERAEAGPLETALNRAPYDLTQRVQQRTLSRIVQSFAFSMSDATH
jgi:hydrogenase large subunit